MAHETHDIAHYTEGDEKAPGMFFLREALGCENLGVTVIDAEAGWSGPEHDHADRGHEEVYVVVNGSATIETGDHEHDLAEGEAIRVDPDQTRRLHAGDEGALIVAAGAP
jgi:quercetin dioxygenase-like cupin family protein